MKDLALELQAFFEEEYLDLLLKGARKGHKHININWHDLLIFNPEMAEYCLNHYEGFQLTAKAVLKEMDLGKSIVFDMVGVYGLPDSSSYFLSELRSKHIDTLVEVEGNVRQKSAIYAFSEEKTFECISCLNTKIVKQRTNIEFKPYFCGGKDCKGTKFRILGSKEIDMQEVVIEEPLEHSINMSQPIRTDCVLRKNLCAKEQDSQLKGGTRIKIVGILRKKEEYVKNAKSNEGKFYIEVINFYEMTDSIITTEFTPQEIEAFKTFSESDKLYEILEDSLVSVKGWEAVKKGLLLSCFGGSDINILNPRRRKYYKQESGAGQRSAIHVLLFGDPGTGKSQMLRDIQALLPKSGFVEMTNSSQVGLTTIVSKDDRGNWRLEAGSMVMANNGHILIDELDKTHNDQIAGLLESMEQGTVTTNKAVFNNVTLPARTTVIAAANPKNGRFDNFKTISGQMNMPHVLINRFDLIYTMHDLPDVKNDADVFDFMANRKKKDDELVELDNQIIDKHFIRKYIQYARTTCYPKLTKTAVNELKEYYLKLRTKNGKDSISISPRQGMALIRLAEAHAKVRLNETAKLTDAKAAVDMMHKMMQTLIYDPNTGELDIDRLEAPQRTNNLQVVESALTELCAVAKKKGKYPSIDEIYVECKNQKVNESKVTEILENLKRRGDIFEPKSGFIGML